MASGVSAIRRVAAGDQLIRLVPPNFRLLTAVIGLHGAAATVSSLDIRQVAHAATALPDQYPPTKALATPTRFLAHLANAWRIGAVLLAPAPAPHPDRVPHAAALLACVADQLLRDSLFHSVSALAILTPDDLPSLDLAADPATPTPQCAERVQRHVVARLHGLQQDMMRSTDRVRDVRGILSMSRQRLRTLRPPPAQIRDVKKRKRSLTMPPGSADGLHGVEVLDETTLEVYDMHENYSPLDSEQALACHWGDEHLPQTPPSTSPQSK